jgi:hypothetical protein
MIVCSAPARNITINTTFSDTGIQVANNATITLTLNPYNPYVLHGIRRLCSLKVYSLKMSYFICNFKKQRIPSEYVGYGLFFYFSGLSLRRTADRLSSCFIKRNHVSIWNWIQKYEPQKLSSEKKKVSSML